jgi:hypothetical protein
MRFKVKTTTIKMYKSKTHPEFGWWMDKDRLKRRIRNHIRGKALAQTMKNRRG